MAFDSVGSDRGGGEAAWIMHQQMQSDPKSSWPSSYNSDNNNWNNGMESQYPGYSNYWYPQSHTAGPYGSTYPPGTEVNGQASYNPQAMSAYPNGVYNPGQYSTSMLHPSNPFYCSDQVPSRQPQYHSQTCPEQNAGGSAPPPYPVPHCQGAPGYPAGSYPHYGEGCHPNAPYPNQQPMLSRPQHEAWSHSGGYGHTPPQQQWPSNTQTPHGHYNHVRPPHPPPWQGPAPPPYEHKDPPYHSQPHMHPRNQPPGSKPRASTPNPTPPPPKAAQFSASPQIYNKAPSGCGGPEPKPAQNEQPPTSSRQGSSTPAPLSDNPSLARVQQVLARVQLLQEDVDEFVGKKTDKSYRCLEELLTKELLELDSVETNGQDVVRQARKESVQRIQAILDRLEKKAF
ncbi:BAG family molecular chaperone regulator 4 [Onychostoma macrolepis]|uniref:BAG family molecular chaperone regulator 4 n=1 Tax=Onychostoma macrolepis TaxID=369639 RepID=UPI002729B36A|nr:BAG family molecular chaperone regulator 4 [Onychostoma macrolepis]